MNLGRFAGIVGAAILILIVNVGLSVVYMVLYGHLINPGQPESFYQEHVKTAAPVSTIICGIPLFYFVCRWLAGKWERSFAVKAAVSVWSVYFLIDVIVLAVSGLTLWVVLVSSVSLSTKFLAAYLGGISASKRAERSI